MSIKIKNYNNPRANKIHANDPYQYLTRYFIIQIYNSMLWSR